MFKKIIAVYTDNHTEPINTKQELLIIEVDGNYSYHSASWG
jgi:hypothetical protein